jgi:hypothetical protein
LLRALRSSRWTVGIRLAAACLGVGWGWRIGNWLRVQLVDQTRRLAGGRCLRRLLRVRRRGSPDWQYQRADQADGGCSAEPWREALDYMCFVYCSTAQKNLPSKRKLGGTLGLLTRASGGERFRNGHKWATVIAADRLCSGVVDLEQTIETTTVQYLPGA